MSDLIPQIQKARLKDLPDFHLSASSAALFLGVSQSRFYRLVDERVILPSGWVDGEMRFRYSTLENYVVNGLPKSIEHLRQSSGTKVARRAPVISSKPRSKSTAEEGQ